MKHNFVGLLLLITFSAIAMIAAFNFQSLFTFIGAAVVGCWAGTKVAEIQNWLSEE